MKDISDIYILYIWGFYVGFYVVFVLDTQSDLATPCTGYSQWELLRVSMSLGKSIYCSCNVSYKMALGSACCCGTVVNMRLILACFDLLVIFARKISLVEFQIAIC